MTPATRTKQKRRTQAERSDAMRKRLLQATLECLAEHGYANTSLSMIVRHAGVSRGAQVHHYPNKPALMNDAAEYLLRNTYRELGEVLLSIANEHDRLQSLVDAVWERLFNTALFRAYCELLVASQSDPELAESLRRLLVRIAEVFTPATTHYFESLPGSAVTPTILFNQLGGLCATLAAHDHLLPGQSFAREQLQLWIQQAEKFMRPRLGVHQPPPKPGRWSSLAASNDQRKSS